MDKYYFGLITCLLFITSFGIAQPITNFYQADITHLSNKISDETQIEDVQFRLTNSFESRNSKVLHSYYIQVVENTDVYGSISNISRLPDGRVLQSNTTAYNPSSIINKITTTELDALEYSRVHFDLSFNETPRLISTNKSNLSESIYAAPSLSSRAVTVKPIFYPVNDDLVLAWSVAFEKIDNQFWYDIIVSAEDGSILQQIDWTLQCSFGHGEDCAVVDGHHDHINHATSSSFEADGSYNVYALPLESPSEGDRSVELAPWENATAASPYGWHDTDGIMGAEFTITRGNNVYASEDRDGNNVPGASPDGGTDLVFDFPIDLATQQPIDYVDAATVNLFYWNNVVHDVLYEHGFDEASGNFQENNYGNGALGNDFVNADAQDGSGTNNATFGTPPDGQNPRMTMFQWTRGTTGGSSTIFSVNSPGNIAGQYLALQAVFGPQDVEVTGDLQLADDMVGDVTDACEPFPPGSLDGQIVLVDRGTCDFITKVRESQRASAIGVVICNNAPGPPIAPAGSGFVGIPSVMISQAACDSIKVELASNPVNVTLDLNPPMDDFVDSDLDNGIIAHEYGHGWSTRLTGGANNSSCLGGSEQMGEGWSDYLGLVMTIKPDEVGELGRGIGTYVINQDSLGAGIRTFPYSTDLSVNPHTYDDIITEAIPHGVGSVWCVMLWDMTWLLIDRYGYDADLYNGSGGNNVALSLVSEGLMLQGCNPGFVDGRDGILAADMALFGGANQCIIWEAFSRRGLGFSADQGTSGSRADGAEAFDLPPNMCFGCTDSSSVNFDPDVTQDDGSCFSCSDGIMNGNETEVDCGGSDCMPCSTCDDGILNGNETEIDCGGPDCDACPTCTDGIMNGDEDDVDCGGSFCAACPCTDIVLVYDGTAAAIDIPDGTDRFVRDYIESQGEVTVQAGTLIELRAEQFIEVMADFEVAQGGELLLDIANCDDSGFSTSVIGENGSPKED